VTTPDIAGTMQAAMDEENRRRELASASPGLGTPLPLAQPVSAAGVGLSDVPMPVVGEGYDITPPVVTAVSKAYGPERPVYGADEVGGVGFVGGRQEPAVRHVTNLGADGLFIEGRPAPAADVVTVASAPSRPGLLSRARAALGRLRGRSR
jgi:hypothetical protein